MKYIVAVVLLGFGALGLVLFYQNRSEQPVPQMSMAADDHDHDHAADGMMAGTVLETMDAGSYTYVHVDTGHEKVWAAGPKTRISTGDRVSFATGMEMRDFKSETLDRSFDSIYFVPAINIAGVAAPGANPHAGVQDTGNDVDISNFEVLDGAMEIAAVYEKKAELSGKKVTVSGKVVKFTPNVMGRNWIHIRDGSGTEGSNDLAVTTDATVRMGDIVLVGGTLVTDKDFGFGYSYEVLVEEATVSTQQ